MLFFSFFGCFTPSVSLKWETAETGGGDSDGEGLPDSESGDSEETGVAPDLGPCADGGWGAGSNLFVLVLPGGDDKTANGTRERPFGTVAAALPFAAKLGPPSILLGPGEHRENIAVFPGYAGATIVGCGIGETILLGDPITDAFYTNADEVRLADLSVLGGDNGITVEEGSLTVEGVRVYHSNARGMYVKSGGALVAAASSIATTAAYGVVVEKGGTLHLNDSEIIDVVETGIRAEEAIELVLSGVTISGVATPNSTADPRDQRSDGVVFGGGVAATLSFDGLTVEGVSRAGLIADGVTVEVLRGTAITAGYAVEGVSLFVQGGGVVTDTGPDPYVTLADENRLSW
ncbi:MAG: hypothetical protein KIH62_004740 [Candidatus Kerfeldbacteria bacterium]|nr:hypothetical protein [Candidatus Kerfeldbacteria bacterium]